MSTQSKVLAYLEKTKGQYCSGEKIAQTLSLSRNAIWKAVNALKEKGYIIASSPQKGYCLQKEGNLLTPESIALFLENPEMIEHVKVYKSLSSTNTFAKTCAAENAPHNSIIIAETQTNGRGRLGRTFYSPSKTGLYFSIILRPHIGIDQSLFITIAASLAVADAIESVFGIPLQIKWVNDLYYKNLKVAGILTEASTNCETGLMDYIVLGVGINLFQPESGAFPDDLKNIAGSLFDKTQGENLRAQLAAALINHLTTLDFNASHSKIMQTYRERSLLIGKYVRAFTPAFEIFGKVIDFNEQGHLLLESDDHQIHTISSGEVSIRLNKK